MSHFADVAGGIALVVAAVGGALIVLPQPKSETERIALEYQPAPVEHVEPLPVKSDAERVEDLQKQLSEIAGEQKRLVEDIQALVAAKKGDPPALTPRRIK